MERLRGAVAHNLETPRTNDAALSENITFESMLLNQTTLNGLHSAGFLRPSPIQCSAIPVGRCGADLIVQAKSGTGKTLVFGIIALEMIDITITQPQVLILAPTREIAVQIKEVLTSISVGLPNLRIEAFIGGLAVSDDIASARGCQIAVGTPGRVKQLVTDGSLSIQAVRLFVLDEADRMVDKTFLKDVCDLFSKLPERKQCIVCSATYPEKMESLLTKFLVNPQRINPSTDTLLLGLRQYVAVVQTHTNILARIRNKTNKLLEILSTLVFKQCLIFCNIQSRMESICRDLAGRGWPALHLAGSMPQKERLAAIAALQNHRCRVLLTTDLAARGVDAEQVDLVINLDLPYDTETYLHRIGRAGRFGAPGIAISIVDDNELLKLREMFYDVGGSGFKVPVLPIGSINGEVWNVGVKLEEIEALSRESNKVEENVTENVEEDCSGDQTNVEMFRSQLIRLPKDFKPIPFRQLVDSFNGLNDESKVNGLSTSLEILGLSAEEDVLEVESKKSPEPEMKLKTLSGNEYLKKETAEDGESDLSEDESSESSVEEESVEDFQTWRRNNRINIQWRQQQLYIEEMCRFASLRNIK